MPPKGKYLLFLILIALITGRSSAQSYMIVKDNLACTYGIKDTSRNKWIVPPQYTLIERKSSGEYLVTLHLQSGLLDKWGREILPCQYDEIDRFPIEWYRTESQTYLRSFWYWDDIKETPYLVRIGDKYGLASHRGKIVLPVQYDKIRHDDPPHVCLYRYEGDSASYTTYTDTSGQIIIPEKPFYFPPFLDNQLTPFANTIEEKWKLVGPIGLMDSTGKVVAPAIYDEVVMRGWEGISVRKGEKIGMLTDAGEVRIPVTYEIIDDPHSVGSLPNIRGSKMWRFQKEGKWGLMNGKGEIILPPEYTAIRRGKYDEATPEYQFMLEKDGKWGTVDPKGKIRVPVQYEVLNPVNLFPRAIGWRHTKEVYFVTYEGGKYGLLNAEGRVILDPLFDNWFLVKNQGKPYAYFTQGLEVYRLNFHVETVSREKLDFVRRTNELAFYKLEDKWVVFELSKADPNQIEHHSYYGMKYKQYGKLLVVDRDKKTEIYDRDGLKIPLEGLTSCHRGVGNMLEVRNTQRRVAILNPLTGQQVTGFDFFHFKQGWGAKNSIWAQVVRSDTQSMRPCGNWMLLDTFFQPLDTQLFDQPYLRKDTSFAHAGGKMGIFDPQGLSWILPPTYTYLVRIADEMCMTLTESRNLGLIRMNGEVVADTQYSHIEEVFSTYSYYDYYPERSLGGEKWWWLTGKDKQLLVNEKGEKFSDPVQIRKKRIELALMTDEKKGSNQCLDCYRVKIGKGATAVLTEGMLRDEVFAQSSRHFTGSGLCAEKWQERVESCSASPIRCPKGKATINRFFVPFAEAHAFSLKVYHYESLSGPISSSSYEFQEWRNYIIKEGKYQQVRIMEVFQTQERLQEELIHAIQLRDDLDLDCTRPKNLTRFIGNRFSFSKKGIVLYLIQDIFNGEVHEILIPWSRLRIYPDTDWLSDLFPK